MGETPQCVAGVIAHGRVVFGRGTAAATTNKLQSQVPRNGTGNIVDDVMCRLLPQGVALPSFLPWSCARRLIARHRRSYQYRRVISQTARSTQHAARSTQHAARRTQPAARSTQHAARSTRHTAHSTQHGAQMHSHMVRHKRGPTPTMEKQQWYSSTRVYIHYVKGA